MRRVGRAASAVLDLAVMVAVTLVPALCPRINNRMETR
ncbi:hypothetical protein AMETH_6307 [Amycolatopsis methanolica 239]|uniref:Uncharacterized protein n=1 Tax=Amycolatopsis methanolica 239 TaxID=1068978 RepID=A0A076N676_AMYME|nr:hypothetical protein AMETH_6248 [Amycolatopsis methanolica 239]AIJ26399.1 hypothetical protein AMETH_6307 [Amycolatopsis methanolica 239]